MCNTHCASLQNVWYRFAWHTLWLISSHLLPFLNSIKIGFLQICHLWRKCFRPVRSTRAKCFHSGLDRTIDANICATFVLFAIFPPFLVEIKQVKILSNYQWCQQNCLFRVFLAKISYRSQNEPKMFKFRLESPRRDVFVKDLMEEKFCWGHRQYDRILICMTWTRSSKYIAEKRK